MKLSVLMPVYNEEKLVEQCLKSFINYVDEVVIVDGSPEGISTDKTAEIVQSYDKVEYISGQFGNNGVWNKTQQMLAGYKHITGNYVISISADMLFDNFAAIVDSIDDLETDILLCPYIEFWIDKYSIRGDTIGIRPFAYKSDKYLHYRNGWTRQEPTEFVIKESSQAVLYNISLYHLGWIRNSKHQIEKHIRHIMMGGWDNIGKQLRSMGERAIEAWSISHVMRYPTAKYTPIMAKIADDIPSISYNDGLQEYMLAYYDKYKEDVYSAIMRLIPPELVR